MLRASEHGGGFAGGIYVDGGRDIVIENNVVTECDLGIEIGAENAGIVTSGIVVRNNVVYGNDKAGLVFGGFQASVGRVQNSHFLNNTCYHNDTLGAGFGELWIQYAEDNVVRNNLFYSTAQNLLLLSEDGNVNNVLDYNLCFTDAGAGSAQFVWKGVALSELRRLSRGLRAGRALAVRRPAARRRRRGGDFHLRAGSPAVERRRSRLRRRRRARSTSTARRA